MFAAVDLGSNSFRLHIGHYDGNTIRVIKSARDPIRLGAGLDAEGNLTSQAMRVATESLARFATVLGAYQLDAVRVVATNTLRIATTGNNNPNYFMLVPTSGINVSAAKSGGNVIISFPTQAGVVYRVFYRDNLTAGSWTLLTTVLGDGAVKSVNDPSTATRRFYKDVAP